MRLVIDYAEVNKEPRDILTSIPNMENTLERIAKCGFQTKMDNRSGFRQVDLTQAAQDLLASATPKDQLSAARSCPSVSQMHLHSFRS